MSTLGSLWTPEVQLFDNTGAPLAGGLVYFYAAGTLTPQDTYPTSALTPATENTNPVVLDSAGRAVIFLQALAYKIIVKTAAGVQVGTTIDNYYPPAYVAQQAVALVTQTTTVTGTQNDFALTTAASVLRVNNATLTTFTGFAAGTDGQSVTVEAVGAGVVALTNQSASSAAANRIIAGLAGTVTLVPGSGRAILRYDATSARWRLILFDQGAWTSTTITSTGTVNDLAGVTSNTFLLCNNATGLILTGFAAGYDGQRLLIVSMGAGAVALSHQNTGSGAANRLINFATSNDTNLAAGKGTAEYVYDGTATRWRLVMHQQGSFIDQTFVAGDFTASAGTWTVASGDVVTFAYTLQGRLLTVVFFVNTTTTSAGMGTDLQIKVPGGYVVNKTAEIPIHTGDNNASAIGFGVVAAAGTQIILRKIDTSAWTSGVTDATYVRGTFPFEVQ